MKRLVLGLSVLSLLTTTSQAFESGTYQCENAFGAGFDTYFLKDNGRAKVTVMGQTTRGYWRDKGDEALVIKEKWVIEKIDNKYVIPMNGAMEDIPCKKLTKSEKLTKLLPKDTELGKSIIQHQNRTQDDKIRDTAKYKAKKLASNWKEHQMMKGMFPPEILKRMFDSDFTYTFNQYSPTLQKLVIEELNKIGTKIPTINK